MVQVGQIAEDVAHVRDAVVVEMQRAQAGHAAKRLGHNAADSVLAEVQRGHHGETAEGAVSKRVDLVILDLEHLQGGQPAEGPGADNAEVVAAQVDDARASRIGAWRRGEALARTVGRASPARPAPGMASLGRGDGHHSCHDDQQRQEEEEGISMDCGGVTNDRHFVFVLFFRNWCGVHPLTVCLLNEDCMRQVDVHVYVAVIAVM